MDDSYSLGLLSSCVHVEWALSQGGTRLEDRPRYNNVSCFETFPFPALEEGELKTRIRELGERLDAHRKARQALHPELTLTGMYNVLEKLRAEEALSDKEKKIHDDGLVTVLKQIHDELDAAVFQAYGCEDLSKEGRESFRPIRIEEIAEERSIRGCRAARIHSPPWIGNRNSSPASSPSTTNAPPRKPTATSAGYARNTRHPMR